MCCVCRSSNKVLEGKREFGIKDYGKLFLAHGGVLDRFDSVLFVTPVIEIILQYFVK